MNGASKTEILIGWLKDWAAQLPWTSIFIYAAMFLFLVGAGYSMGRKSAQANEGPVVGFFERPVLFFFSTMGLLGFLDFVQFMQGLPRLGGLIGPLQ